MSQATDPYQPPQVTSKSAAQRKLKVGISSFVILVLMPVAMIVAFGIGCGVGLETGVYLFPSYRDSGQLILFLMASSWIPPLVAMTVMLLWFFKARRREAASANQTVTQERGQE